MWRMGLVSRQDGSTALEIVREQYGLVYEPLRPKYAACLEVLKHAVAARLSASANQSSSDHSHA